MCCYSRPQQTKLGINWVALHFALSHYSSPSLLLQSARTSLHTHLRACTHARSEFLLRSAAACSNSGGKASLSLQEIFSPELLSVFMTRFVNRCKNKSPMAQTTGSPFCFRFWDLLYLSNRQKHGHWASTYCKQGWRYGLSSAVTKHKERQPEKIHTHTHTHTCMHTHTHTHTDTCSEEAVIMTNFSAACFGSTGDSIPCVCVCVCVCVCLCVNIYLLPVLLFCNVH